MSEENEPVQDTTDPGQKLYGDAAEGEQAEEKPESDEAESKEEVKSEDDASDDKSDEAAEGEKSEDGDKPADDDKQEAKSDEIKLEVPEDSELTEDNVKEIEAFAKDNGLSREAAEKVLDMQHKLLSEYKESASESLKEVSDTWRSEASKDKEYGGEHFTKNVELAKRAVERFATEAFMDDLDRTGFGNHPELLRTFYRVGKAMGEGGFVKPGTQAGHKKTYEELFYGEQTN